MDAALTGLKEFYNRCESKSDPRTKDWFLVPSFYGPLIACVLYIIIVIIGPRIMEQRKPFELKIPMALYNFGAVALNLHVTIELFFGSWDAGYSYVCQDVVISTEPKHMRITNALWWFYVSKYYEVLDTVFFILRKKTNQISFLHVYHHASIIVLWWIGLKWVPGGSSFNSSLINSCVHVVMYSYYALSVFPSLRSYLWWKRYLTQFQLIQFLLNVVHSIAALYDDCGYPRWVSYGMMMYMATMISFFCNFYVKTYSNAKLSKKLDDAGETVKLNGVHENGRQKKFD